MDRKAIKTLSLGILIGVLFAFGLCFVVFDHKINSREEENIFLSDSAKNVDTGSSNDNNINNSENEKTNNNVTADFYKRIKEYTIKLDNMEFHLTPLRTVVTEEHNGNKKAVVVIQINSESNYFGNKNIIYLPVDLVDNEVQCPIGNEKLSEYIAFSFLDRLYKLKYFKEKGKELDTQKEGLTIEVDSENLITISSERYKSFSYYLSINNDKIVFYTPEYFRNNINSGERENEKY